MARHRRVLRRRALGHGASVTVGRYLAEAVGCFSLAFCAGRAMLVVRGSTHRRRQAESKRNARMVRAKVLQEWATSAASLAAWATSEASTNLSRPGIGYRCDNCRRAAKEMLPEFIRVSS